MTFVLTQLPMYTDTYYRYTINLEGRQRTMVYYWNEREGAWHFDLKDADGTSVLLGQKIVAQYPIAADYRLEGRNLSGYFILLPNNTSTRLDPTDSSVAPQFFKFYYIYQPPE